MSNVDSHRTLNSLIIGLWWMRVPAATRRVSRILPAILADGLYLSAWPRVAAIAPPLALLLGLLLGWLHFAPGETFTFSILVMALMLLVSNFSAALGAWLWLGYVVGDFFLFRRNIYSYSVLEQFVHVRVPLLIAYVLLAMLLVFIPLLSPWLRRQVLTHLHVPRIPRIVINTTLQAILQAVLVYVWVQAVPTLIRPVYTWQGGTPPIEAIQPLQQNGWVLVILAGLVGAMRMVLQYRAFGQHAVVQRAAQLRTALRESAPVRRELPLGIGVLLKAAFLTLLLSGLLTTWLQAIGLAVAWALIMLWRETVLPRLDGWLRLVSRVPLVIRLALSALISYFLGLQIVGAPWDGTSTFLPIIIAMVISLAVCSLLTPGRAEAMPRQPMTGGRRT